jgi:PAS domain S-box-containing protein
VCCVPASAQEQPDTAELEKQVNTVSGKERLQLLVKLADIYWRTDPDKCLAYARQAWELAGSVDSPWHLYKALNHLGSWHYIHDQYEDAVRYYLLALDLEPRIEDKRLIANILVNIGMVYWKLGQLDKAETFHTRSLELRKKTGYTAFQMAATLNNLGLVLFEKGKLKRALEYYKEALEYYRESGHKRGTAAALINLNNVYAQLKNFPEALTCLGQALAIYKEIGYRWGEINAVAGMGGLYILMRRWDRALPALTLALQMALESNEQIILKRVYQDLSQLYEKKGDYRKAVQYHEKYRDTKHTLREQRSKDRAAVLKTVYETGKKNAELALLRKSGERDRILVFFLVAAGLLSLLLTGLLLLQFRTGKRINRLLSQSEARYRTLFSRAGDGIFLISSGRIIDCNDTAVEMLGANREEITGAFVTDFSPASQPDGRNSRQAGREYLADTQAGESQRFYWQFIKTDGTPLHAIVSLAAVSVQHRPYVQAIVHDIGDRKRLEDERVRSAKLETVDLLAGGIARDFSILLEEMQISIEQVKAENKSGVGLAPFITRIEKAVQSAEQLSETFLTVAEGGFHPRELLAVGSLLRETAAAAVEAAGTEVEYRHHIPADLWQAEGDKLQIRRLIEILVKNALQAMGNGGKLRVNAANLDAAHNEVPGLTAGNYVNLTITDNGEGIPREILPKVFDPYFTTRGEVTRKGVGMGLALARSIVERHDGAIDISSQVGKGTTCNIFLPANQGAG